MSQDSQTLDQTLKKTDFGMLVNQNKKALLVIMLALIALAFGLNIYFTEQTQEKIEDLNSLYQFRVEKFQAFKEGKTNYETFEKELNAVRKDLITSPLALSLVTDIAEDLTTKEKTAKATEILENISKNLNKTELSYALTSFRLVTLYENAGAHDKAVNVLENVLKSGHKEVESKVYFDLGRNFMYANKKDQAKTNFEYVIKNFADSQYAKMSKLYLEKL